MTHEPIVTYLGNVKCALLVMVSVRKLDCLQYCDHGSQVIYFYLTGGAVLLSFSVPLKCTG